FGSLGSCGWQTQHRVSRLYFCSRNGAPKTAAFHPRMSTLPRLLALRTIVLGRLNVWNDAPDTSPARYLVLYHVLHRVRPQAGKKEQHGNLRQITPGDYIVQVHNRTDICCNHERIALIGYEPVPQTP